MGTYKLICMIITCSCIVFSCATPAWLRKWVGKTSFSERLTAICHWGSLRVGWFRHSERLYVMGVVEGVGVRG